MNAGQADFLLVLEGPSRRAQNVGKGLPGGFRVMHCHNRLLTQKQLRKAQSALNRAVNH